VAKELKTFDIIKYWNNIKSVECNIQTALVDTGSSTSSESQSND